MEWINREEEAARQRKRLLRADDDEDDEEEEQKKKRRNRKVLKIGEKGIVCIMRTCDRGVKFLWSICVHHLSPPSCGGNNLKFSEVVGHT